MTDILNVKIICKMIKVIIMMMRRRMKRRRRMYSNFIYL